MIVVARSAERSRRRAVSQLEYAPRLQRSARCGELMGWRAGNRRLMSKSYFGHGRARFDSPWSRRTTRMAARPSNNLQRTPLHPSDVPPSISSECGRNGAECRSRPFSRRTPSGNIATQSTANDRAVLLFNAAWRRPSSPCDVRHVAAQGVARGARCSSQVAMVPFSP